MVEDQDKLMSKFSTYSMAGVGIAAAIGFVFALSFLSNSPGVDNGSDLMRQPGTEPSSLLMQQRLRDSGASLSDGNQDMAAKPMDANENEMRSGGESASSMMQQSEEAIPLRPTLLSIVASDGSTGQTIGDVSPQMQFEAGKAVFIKVDLANPNDVQISDIIIALGISSGSAEGATGEQEGENSAGTLTQPQSYEQATSFHGDIGAGENLLLELYWNPSEKGEYTLLLFSIAPEDLNTTKQIEPIASIPIKVVDPTSS